MPEFIHRTALPVPASLALAWHQHDGALSRLLPPWPPVRIEEAAPAIPGREAVLAMGPRLLSQRWVARHESLRRGLGFADVQAEGPFKYWRHEHRFIPHGRHACVLEDAVEWRGGLLPQFAVRHLLQQTFQWRGVRTHGDIVAAAHWWDCPRRTVLITGASGFISSGLIAYLRAAGHTVRTLSRRQVAEPQAFQWKPEQGVLPVAALTDVDVVIHAAGATVGRWPWTASYRDKLINSRIVPTRFLAEQMAQHCPQARFIVCTGAAWFGDSGEEVCVPEGAAGSGFLAQLCQDWEAALAPAQLAGIHCTALRLGLVLDASGGLLQRLRWPARLGLAGRIGDGQQWWPWIERDELYDLLQSLICCEQPPAIVHGVHAAERQAVLAQRWASRLAHKWQLPTPEWVVRNVGGLMGRELLLASQRLTPAPVRELGWPAWRDTSEV